MTLTRDLIRRRRAAEARLMEANRKLAQAQGRAAAGDPDDAAQAREALAEVRAASEELAHLNELEPRP
jgi:hypothetical protein